MILLETVEFIYDLPPMGANHTMLVYLRRLLDLACTTLNLLVLLLQSLLNYWIGHFWSWWGRGLYLWVLSYLLLLIAGVSLSLGLCAVTLIQIARLLILIIIRSTKGSLSIFLVWLEIYRSLKVLLCLTAYISIDSLLLNLRCGSSDRSPQLVLSQGSLILALIYLWIILFYYVRELLIGVSSCWLLLLRCLHYHLVTRWSLLALWAHLMRILIFHALLTRSLYFLWALSDSRSLLNATTGSLIRRLKLSVLRSLHVVDLKAVVVLLLRALNWLA
jgi:hypothetical protein